MDATTFIAGFLSCTTVTFFLLGMALLLRLSRPQPSRPETAGAGRVEVLPLRIPDVMEPQVTKLMLEAGYVSISARAVNGNRLVDIMGYRVTK